MAIILRMDIDRPYGKSTLFKHIASIIGSEYYFPRIPYLGYLNELHQLLRLMNDKQVRSYVLFRKCTLPCEETMKLMEQGNHILGLHLENSRSFETFHSELKFLETYSGKKIVSFSKHGSGIHKYGFHHYAPYEPEKYVAWAEEIGLKLFLGNLEDPAMECYTTKNGLTVFPSAFWLEPHWRDTTKYTREWLCREAEIRDVVLLLHPDNVMSDRNILADLQFILDRAETKIL